MATPGHDLLPPDASVSPDSHDVYEIRIKGLLDEHWLHWFEGMTLTREEDDGQDCTVLIGAIADQPALHGLLERIRDLNLTLLSVRKIAASEAGGQPDPSEAAPGGAPGGPRDKLFF